MRPYTQPCESPLTKSCKTSDTAASAPPDGQCQRFSPAEGSLDTGSWRTVSDHPSGCNVIAVKALLSRCNPRFSCLDRRYERAPGAGSGQRNRCRPPDQMPHDDEWFDLAVTYSVGSARTSHSATLSLTIRTSSIVPDSPASGRSKSSVAFSQS